MINIDFKKDDRLFEIEGSLGEVALEFKYLAKCYMKKMLNEGKVQDIRDAGKFLMALIIEGAKEIEKSGKE